MHAAAITGQAAGEIGILQVEEIALVETADAAEGITANQHAAATQVGRLKHLLVVLIRHHIPAVVAI